jgi:hypothetical protein
MLLDFVPRHESFQLLVTDEFNFIDFVRGPKAVHEMQKGDSRLEGGHLGNDSHVVGLLDAKG